MLGRAVLVLDLAALQPVDNNPAPGTRSSQRSSQRPSFSTSSRLDPSKEPTPGNRLQCNDAPGPRSTVARPGLGTLRRS
ncbi:hypothetical protein LA080_014657 [Diaporthe eres]|uniref:Uncharacterized protein n=1 Tax=Diaporthe vaccinii TaxID=105482 RepID=A0ABR4ELD4_9PEZI|nr:hypothetical protein LA080_014657 [Diaporthe eres]